MGVDGAYRPGPSIWGDVVIPMLAVSQYPIDRIEPNRQAMRSANLFDLHSFAPSSIGALAEELKSTGYDRGKLTSQYADRLISLGKHLCDRDVREAERRLGSGDASEIESELLPIYGIGPKVIQNFIDLRARKAQGGKSARDA